MTRPLIRRLGAQLFAIAALFAAAPAFAQTSVHNLHMLDATRATVQERCYALVDGSLACGNVQIDPETGNPYSSTDPPPLPNGAAQDGTDQTGVSPPTGAVGIRGWLSALFADLGAPGATACATDNGSCTINALLQRIAQRLTSLIGATLTVQDAPTEASTSAAAAALGAPGASPPCTADNASCTITQLLARISRGVSALDRALAGAKPTPQTPLPTQMSIGGLLVSALNPFWTALSQGGYPVGPNNPVWTTQGGTTWTACSLSSVATGGTSVVASAADGARKRYKIQNPVSTTSEGIGATENLFINLGAAASTTNGQSIELLPGGADEDVSTQSLNVNAATSGHQFLCWTLK